MSPHPANSASTASPSSRRMRISRSAKSRLAGVIYQADAPGARGLPARPQPHERLATTRFTQDGVDLHARVVVSKPDEVIAVRITAVERAR